MEKKGTPASPATALAKRVLPVPGGPTKITPLGILAPTSVYFFGFFRKSTISSKSSFSSSRPATLEKSTELVRLILARLFPKFIILLFPPPPPIRAFMYIIRNMITTAERPMGRIMVIR